MTVLQGARQEIERPGGAGDPCLDGRHRRGTRRRLIVDALPRLVEDLHDDTLSPTCRTPS